MNSMTGYGNATAEGKDELISVELSSVNNRYLKINSKAPEILYPFEREIEEAITGKTVRGTVYVTIAIQSSDIDGSSKIDEEVAAEYIKQARALAKRHKLSDQISLDALLALPNVIRPKVSGEREKQALWKRVKTALDRALDNLCRMRANEGAKLKKEMVACIALLKRLLADVDRRRPAMVEEYKKRFQTRLKALLKESGVSMPEEGVLREVAIFADRCDVAEEISRLSSHFSQFLAALDSKDAPGKKLDFITQEMLREVNTIGAKSNDADSTRIVVEMKTEIGKIKEQIQNVE
jgi:uncharacterized protein (TIGR00255 family)